MESLARAAKRLVMSSGAPRTIHQVWCKRCGCGNVNREPYFEVAYIRKHGCGITHHQSCSGCLCHTEPKPWRKNWKQRKDLPELEFVEVVVR